MSTPKEPPQAEKRGTLRRQMPAELKPDQVWAVVDSREQTPLDLAPLQTTTAGLTTGDYSVVGLEHIVAVERKSLPDLIGCVGRERERFDREVARLLAFPSRLLIVEATYRQLEEGEWRGKITPRMVLGSLAGWEALGLPVALVGDHRRAGEYTSRFLFLVARRRWRENRALATSVMEGAQ